MSAYVKKSLIQIGVLLALLWASSMIYVVDEKERVVVLQMGKPTEEVPEPGLHVKAPWPFQGISVLDKRYQILDSRPRDVQTLDSKLLQADDFAIFRIVDGVKFLASARTMQNVLTQLDNIVFNEVRTEIGKHTLQEVIATHRKEVMDNVTTRVNDVVKEFGIEVALVRVTRADLPRDNKSAIEKNMQAERNQMATQYRAEGTSEATRITAEADRDVVTILAEAERDAQRIRGEGDAAATKIYNDAYGKNPEFFAFYRGLQAARKSLTSGGDIRWILGGKEAHLDPVFGSKK